jgi:hypothetical protein
MRGPVLSRIVEIEVHLASVGVGEFSKLQIYDDEATKLPVEEEQVDSIPFRAYPQPFLPSHKGEIAAKFEQEMLNAPDQRGFKIGLGILIFEVEKLEDERVSDFGVGRLADIFAFSYGLCTPSGMQVLQSGDPIDARTSR